MKGKRLIRKDIWQLYSFRTQELDGDTDNQDKEKKERTDSNKPKRKNKQNK